jgi:outer membrane lipoprotein-sorting protein
VNTVKFVKIVSLLVVFFGVVECRANSERYREVFEAMRSRYEEVRDYQCRLLEWSAEGGRYEKRTINFYFKKPKLIRMDILKGNRPFDSGSVAVYLGSGKVSGHRGGVLKDIVLNVAKTSALATTIRGVAIDESDMETVLNKIPFYLENGTILMSEGDDVYVFVCVPFDPSENEGISKDILRIDKKSLLVLYNERFVGDSPVQKVEWRDYIVNAGLPDELFDLRFDVNELVKRGIPLVRQTVD